MSDEDVADVSWIKRKLRPHLFKAWEWSCGGFDGDDGGLMHDDGQSCPGAGCNDPSCPSWG